MKGNCIIIGGGIGGLFTGAFLAKNGCGVTILEKNSIIGGGLQCFSRNGKIYETGMHIIGGFEPNGSLYKICKYLGIYDRLRIERIPHECSDEIYFHRTNETFKIASGREGFIASISRYFPHERAGIEAYVDALFRITEEVPMFRMHSDSKGYAAHSDEYVMPADELIGKYITDAHLREVLAYLNPLYGGVKGHTPAYIHALLSVLYIKGTSRFIAGSQQLADALTDVITEHGGKVATNAEVTEIEVENKVVQSVTTADGTKYVGDMFVSSMHPTELLKLVPKGTFRKVFVNRLNEIPNTYSAFSLFIDLKPNSLPYIDHTRYYVEDYGNIWEQNIYDESTWPRGFMFMTPPDTEHGKYAERLLVHCAMDFEQVRKWQDTTVGNRSKEYTLWKSEQSKKIIKKLERVLPGISDKIEHLYAATPLTIRDYYHTKDGAIFGYRKDSANLIYSQLGVYTKVKNLFLTGQNVNLHGICGVPLTAINTAEAILGDNVIINAINHGNEAK
jgi:all-trans-retinol 13,14-reductase